MKTKCTIAGREIELESGRTYMCGVSIRGSGESRFAIDIRDVTEKEWFCGAPEVMVIQNLNGDQADDFLYEFNHGDKGFADRTWE